MDWYLWEHVEFSLPRDDVLCRATAQFHATYIWFSWAPLSPAPQASGNIATWTPRSICRMPQSDQSATWTPIHTCFQMYTSLVHSWSLSQRIHIGWKRSICHVRALSWWRSLVPTSEKRQTLLNKEQGEGDTRWRTQESREDGLCEVDGAGVLR